MDQSLWKRISNTDLVIKKAAIILDSIQLIHSGIDSRH